MINVEKKDNVSLDFLRDFFGEYAKLLGIVLAASTEVRKNLVEDGAKLDRFVREAERSAIEVAQRMSLKFEAVEAYAALSEINRHVVEHLKPYTGKDAAERLVALSTAVFRMSRHCLPNEQMQDIKTAYEIIMDDNLIDAPETDELRKMIGEAWDFIVGLDSLSDGASLQEVFTVNIRSKRTTGEIARILERSVSGARKSNWVWLAQSIVAWAAAAISVVGWMTSCF